MQPVNSEAQGLALTRSTKYVMVKPQADKELDELKKQARGRADALINSIEFIGFAGAKIKDDGSYDVLIPVKDHELNEIPETIREELGSRVTGTLEKDTEFQDLLSKIRNHAPTQKALKETGIAGDTFEPAADAVYLSYSPKKSDAFSNGRRFDEYLTNTRLPYPTSNTYSDVEKWLKDGGENPLKSWMDLNA